MQWEHSHLVGNITRGPKSLNGQRAKVIVTRQRDLEGGIPKPEAGQFVLHFQLLQLILLSPSLGSGIESTLTLDLGGQGNSTFGEYVFQF